MFVHYIELYSVPGDRVLVYLKGEGVYLRIEGDVFPSEPDVLDLERLPVRPLEALPELHGPDAPILADLKGLTHVGVPPDPLRVPLHPVSKRELADEQEVGGQTEGAAVHADAFGCIDDLDVQWVRKPLADSRQLPCLDQLVRHR